MDMIYDVICSETVDSTLERGGFIVLSSKEHICCWKGNTHSIIGLNLRFSPNM